MNAAWQMWSGRFAPEWCNLIIGLAKELPAQNASVMVKNQAQTQNDTRRTTVRWIKREHQELNFLFPLLEDYFHEANHAAFGVELWRLRSIQFTEYHESVQGHYDWHNDVLWGDGTPVHRKLSMVIQLSSSSEYEGANLELKPFYLNAPDEAMLKQQGTVIVFPSIVEHRVTPITKGTRYSMVAWMEGPKWR